MRCKSLIISCLVLVWGVCLGAIEPDALYLTWTGDPTTSMTVVWFGGDGSQVMYHQVGDSSWLDAKAVSHGVTETAAVIYVSQIEGLKSDATYVFKVEGSKKNYRFRTLPEELSREVRFVVGGDVFYYEGTDRLERMNHAVAYDDPDFVVLGGDLAYVTGTKRVMKDRSWEVNRWKEFFQVMQRSMVAKEGRLIPMVPVIGNHDVHDNSTKPQIFYDVFPFPKKGRAYRNIKFGKYLDLVLLDTGHTWPIDGKQAEWLKATLKAADTSFVFAVYHVGAYPSFYPYNGSVPALIRKTWVPLFEEARISGAFEHHSHALKRTFPIKEGKVDPKGVTYFGDGSWGVPPRKAHTTEELWYLAMSESVNACWFVKLTQQGADIEARTEVGEIKDRMRVGVRK